MAGAGSGRATWRAVLKHVSGSKEHIAFMLGRQGIAPLPDPVALRIIPDGAGYALLRLDKATTNIAHTWHPTLEEARASAATAYGVAEDEGRSRGRQDPEALRGDAVRDHDRPHRAEAAVHRFGSSLNAHTHFHVVVLDGVYIKRGEGVAFFASPAPTREALHVLVMRVVHRAMKWLKRKRYVREDIDDNEEAALTPLEALTKLAMPTSM